jgi:predicted nucleic acid-binding protein
MHLLDTNVISELRKAARADPHVLAWASDVPPAALFISVITLFAIDATIARRWAALHVPDPRSDRDSLIAATALEHGFNVVTRNAADFAGIGVKLINPWESE